MGEAEMLGYLEAFQEITGEKPAVKTYVVRKRAGKK